MADKTDTAIIAGPNMERLMQDVKNGVAKIEGLKEKRNAINDKIAGIRSDLQAKGIHKKALDMAMNYLNMDPDKREGFDLAYDIVRDSIELPVQRELFEGERSEKSDNAAA